MKKLLKYKINGQERQFHGTETEMINIFISNDIPVFNKKENELSKKDILNGADIDIVLTCKKNGFKVSEIK